MTRWERLDQRSWLVRGACQGSTYFAFCVAGVELLRREGVVSRAVYGHRSTVMWVVLWVALVLYRWFRERQAAE